MKINVFLTSFLSAILLATSAVSVYAVANNVVISDVVTQTGDDLVYGSAGTATFSLEATGDEEPGTVTWSVTDLPVGMTYSFSATSTTGTGAWATELLVKADDTFEAGLYEVTVEALGDGIIDAVDSLTIKFQVLPITLDGSTLEAEDREYNGTTTVNIIGEATGKLVGDDVEIYGYFYSKNAGENRPVKLELSGVDADNYEILTNLSATITPRAISIVSGDFAAADKVYDGTTEAKLNNSPVNLIFDNLIEGDVLTVSSGSGTTADKNVGVGKVVAFSSFVLDGLDAGNYLLQNQPSAETQDYTKKTITVTPRSTSKEYDGATSSTATPTVGGGLETGDIAQFSQYFLTKEAGEDKEMGAAGTINDGNGGLNYEVTFNTDFVGDITKAPLTVSGLSALDKIYDGGTLATLSTSSTLVGVIGLDVVTLDISGATANFVGENAGTNKSVTVTDLALAGTDANNYSVTSPAVKGNILPRPITITAATDSRAYDQSTSSVGVPTITSGELVLEDNAVYTQSFATKQAGTNKEIIPSVAITDGNDGNNYTVTKVSNNTGVITAIPLLVTAVANNKVYDGTTTASVVFSDNRIAGDILTATGAASFSDKTVGAGKVVNIPKVTLTGADAGNYVPFISTNTKGNITRRPLTIEIIASNKIFDNNTKATITTTDNRVAGDILTISYPLDGAGSPAFATSSISVNTLVSVSGLTISGFDSTNYTHNIAATSTASIIEPEKTSTRTSGGGSNSSKSLPQITTPSKNLVATVATSSTKFIFLVDLSIGSTHPDVVELQKVLIAGGFLNIAAPTGYFGPLTLAGVKAYQAANPEIGFVTGYFGPLTRAVMNK